MIVRIFSYALFCLSLCAHIFAGELSKNELPLSFYADHILPSPEGNSFFMINNQENALDSSISVFNDAQSFVAGVVPEKITLNGEPEQANPLYNAKIAFLKTLPASGALVAVKQDDWSINAFINYSSDQKALFSISSIFDASVTQISKILSFQTGKGSYMFAAVLGKNDISFGDGTSGIAFIKFKSTTLENRATSYFLEQIDPIKQPEEPKIEDDINRIILDTELEERKKPKPVINIPRALALSRSSNLLAWNHPLAEISNVIDLHWSDALNLLFIALQVKAGDQENAGCCAILAANIDDQDKVTMAPICQSTIFESGRQNKIVGALGSQQQVSIHKILTMKTSTGLDYLIINGGNGEPDSNKNHVYALPITNHKDRPDLRGRLANVAKKVDMGTILPNYHYVGVRGFTDLATLPEEVYTSDHAQARVGGGPLLAGNIRTIKVIEDSVFASVEDPADGQLPGLHQSQALFDEQGMIRGWTQWQRVCAITDHVLDVNFSNPASSLVWICKNSDDQQTIKHINWQTSQEKSPFAREITSVFQSENGIGGIFDFQPHAHALAKNCLLVAVGGEKIAITQSGTLSGGMLMADDLNAKKIIEGATSLAENCAILNCPELRPIKSAQLIGSHNQCWLAIGGMQGVAIACKNDGSGWPRESAPELADFSFRKIGNYRSVQKLVADKEYLYVLTDNRLERINIARSNFATNQLETSIIAESAAFSKARFFDCLVSEKVGLLATSAGLYRIANGKDVANVQDTNDAQWTPINLPESVLPIVKLQPYSATHCPQDISRACGGMVHVIGSYRGKNKTHLHRLSIASTEHEQINDATVQLIPELISWGEKSTFATFHPFKENFISDGAFYFSSPGPDGKKAALVCGLKKNEIAPLQLSEADRIMSITQNSATGSWLIAGTFGLIVHE